MTKILVLGKTGQLGRALQEATWPASWHPRFVGRAEADLENSASLRRIVEKSAPDIVINAAAYTAVDRAESESARAWQANAIAPGTLAAAAARIDAPIVHISTDYVFDGSKAVPWREEDPVGPLGVYGASKAAGEQNVAAHNPRHLIVRVSWLYSTFGSNFAKNMLRLGRERAELSIVDDQFGRPTSATDLAQATLHAAKQALDDGTSWGHYHFSNSGDPVSWYGFAEAIFNGVKSWTGAAPRLKPIPTEQFPTPARRPANSVLSTVRFEERFGFQPPAWDRALGLVIERLKSQTQASLEQ